MSSNQSLGSVQRYVLRHCLGDTSRSSGSWYPGCGWNYGSASRTGRIMNSLDRRKLVDTKMITDRSGNPVVEYTINDAGRAAIREFC